MADEGVGAALLTNIVMQVFVQGGDGKQDEDSECVNVCVRTLVHVFPGQEGPTSEFCGGFNCLEVY